MSNLKTYIGYYKNQPVMFQHYGNDSYYYTVMLEETQDVPEIVAKDDKNVSIINVTKSGPGEMRKFLRLMMEEFSATVDYIENELYKTSTDNTKHEDYEDYEDDEDSDEITTALLTHAVFDREY